jgi:hypothetical protein
MPVAKSGCAVKNPSTETARCNAVHIVAGRTQTCVPALRQRGAAQDMSFIWPAAFGECCARNSRNFGIQNGAGEFNIVALLSQGVQI